MSNLCRNCQKRPALFIRRQKRYHKPSVLIIRADDDHDLCMRCFKSERDRQMARELAARA